MRMNSWLGSLAAKVPLPWWARSLVWMVRIVLGYLVTGIVIWGIASLRFGPKAGTEFYGFNAALMWALFWPVMVFGWVTGAGK